MQSHCQKSSSCKLDDHNFNLQLNSTSMADKARCAEGVNCLCGSGDETRGGAGGGEMNCMMRWLFSTKTNR